MFVRVDSSIFEYGFFKHSSLCLSLFLMSCILLSGEVCAEKWGTVQLHWRDETPREKSITVKKSVNIYEGNRRVSRTYTFGQSSSEAGEDKPTLLLWQTLPNELKAISDGGGRLQSLVATFAHEGGRRPSEVLNRLRRPRAIRQFQASTLYCLIALEDLIAAPVGEDGQRGTNPQGLPKASFKDADITFRIVFSDGEARELYTARGFDQRLLQLPDSRFMRHRVSNCTAPANLSFVDYALPEDFDNEKTNSALVGRIRVWMAKEGHAARAPVSLVTSLRHTSAKFGGDLETRFSESGAIQFVPEEATENEAVTLNYVRKVACTPGRRSEDFETLKEVDMHLENWKWEFEWEEGDTKICGELVDIPGKTIWDRRSSPNGRRTLTFSYKSAEVGWDSRQHKLSMGRALLPRKLVLVSHEDTAKHKVDEIHFYPVKFPAKDKLNSKLLTKTLIRCLSLLNSIGYLEARKNQIYSLRKRLPPQLMQSLDVLNHCRFFVHLSDHKSEMISLDFSEHKGIFFSESIEWERKYYLEPQVDYFQFSFRGSTGTFLTSLGLRKVVFTRAKNTPENHWALSDFLTCPVGTATLFSRGDDRLWTLSARRVSPPADYFVRMRYTKEMRAKKELQEYQKKQKQTRNPRALISEPLVGRMTEKEKEKVRMFIAVANSAKALFYLNEGRGGNISEEELGPYLEKASGGKVSSWGELPTPCNGYYQIRDEEQSVIYIE